MLTFSFSTSSMSKMHLELKAVRIIHTFSTLDKTISSLERQLAAARAAKADTEEGSPMVTKSGTKDLNERQRVFFVMGIITALRNIKRRNSIRETWMPQGLIQYSFGILPGKGCSQVFIRFEVIVLRGGIKEVGEREGNYNAICHRTQVSSNGQFEAFNFYVLLSFLE